MSREKARLIVALDIGTLKEAKNLIDVLSPVVDIFKVGSQLFTACGPAAVRLILARGKKVFLDLKYHDIPNTVANAVRIAVDLSTAVGAAQSTSNTCHPAIGGVGVLPYLPVVMPRASGDSKGRPLTVKNKADRNPESIFMYTLHAQGGKAMLAAAVEAGQKKAEELGVTKPLAVAITVLTSEEKQNNLQSLVLERALLAKEAGCDGVVASVQEAEFIRQKLGKDFIIVTPGIRLKDIHANDQKRIATPAEAVLKGSNFLVVGRPIVEANNPLGMAKQILKEMDVV